MAKKDTAPAPMPTEGGSYVRQPDGTLAREPAPAEAAKAADEATTTPKEPAA